MKLDVRLGTPTTGLMHRVTRAMCPRGDRRWVDAAFAEASFVEGRWRRMTWALGAFSLVAAAIKLNVAALPARVRLASALAFAAATLSSIGSFTGYEGLTLDDDVYLGTASLSCLALLGLVMLAVKRVYTAPGPSPEPSQ